MPIKEFFKPTNKSIFYWLILGAVVLVMVGIILWQWSIGIKVIPEPQHKVEINNKTCSSDNDCVILTKSWSENSCCDSCDSEAINKQAQKKRDEWRIENCKNARCPVYDCYDEKLPVPKCVNNLCEIEWVERNKINTSNWKTYRNEKQNFEIKLPMTKEWKEDIRINNKDNEIFDGWFSAASGKKEYSFRIKINLFGELTPLLPKGDFSTDEEEIMLFEKWKVKETIFSSQKTKEYSILSQFCMDKMTNIKNPEINNNYSESQLSCHDTESNYSLYDFNLYCNQSSEKDCKKIFNQILSTFNLLRFLE